MLQSTVQILSACRPVRWWRWDWDMAVEAERSRSRLASARLSDSRARRLPTWFDPRLGSARLGPALPGLARLSGGPLYWAVYLFERSLNLARPARFVSEPTPAAFLRALPLPSLDRPAPPRPTRPPVVLPRHGATRKPEKITSSPCREPAQYVAKLTVNVIE